jgi:CRISPR/Cas system-associated protein endoribonuclease Cas2
MELSEEIKKAVQSEIRKDCWREAKTILWMTTAKNREDFLQYHNEDKGNICCLVLDFAKMELVKEKKMIQNDNDNFGKPLV